jgi:hypothetical protein
MRRRMLTAVLAILLLAALLLAMPAIRGYEALLMLAELVGRPVPPWIDFRPLSARRAITYEREGRRHGADLYQPEGRVRAGVVFVPGAVEQGKDDPRVVAFASALARSRFAVLVPDIVALRALRLLPDSAVDVADALALMDARKDLAPGGRLGLLTTSVGIGPAMITMLDPASDRHVRFFVSIGGYYDLPRTLAYLTTGHYEAHGVTRRDAPNDYGKWIYALSNAARLQNAAERTAFETLARRKLADSNADVSRELRQLGPAGRAAYAYIVNIDAARSPELLEQLPSYLRADVDRLNLAASDLGWLPARFILVHGVGDNMIPYGESIGLAAALPPERTRLFLLTGFYHVEMAPQLVDGFRLWRAMCALLAER